MINLEILTLSGYGQFVWPAFVFTLVSLLVLYLKVKKELNKQESIYLKENKQIQTIRVKAIKDKKITEEVLSGSSI